MLARTARMRQVRLLGLLLLILLGVYMFWGSAPKLTKSTPKSKGEPEVEEEIESEGKRTLYSSSYDINYPPTCFQINCDKQNNLEALTPCTKRSATRSNTLGVKAMERFVGSSAYPDSYSNKFLSSAANYFHEAIKQDPSCITPRVNLALVQMEMSDLSGDHKLDSSIQIMTEVIKTKPKEARLYSIRGFLFDLLGKDFESKSDWDKAVSLNPRIAEGRYFGIIVANDTQMARHSSPYLFTSLRTLSERVALRDALTWVEFSPIHLAQYAVVNPLIHETFVETRYTVVQNIIPPFLFNPITKYYWNAIHTDKKLNINDGQSKRYYMANDRVARFLQYQLADLLRKISAHNAIPSYTYFGGYVEDAVLVPHADRKQCEFTFSLTVYQNPSNVSWPLALGNRTRFEKDQNQEGGYLDLPPEEQHVVAPLLEGDALLFMGRHLIHWRIGEQPKGHETYNIFIHFVQNDFPLTLE